MGSKQNSSKKWLQEAWDLDLSFGYVSDEGDEGRLWRWMRLDEEPLSLVL